MDLFGALTMLGGLALFLFGMNAMGDGLTKVSGGKLERVLEKLTSNRLMGVILGAGVTAIIQSSSATTVMVVGFVNSGIMKLKQAVGVIMGANIGTTMTSWILSLAGVEGGNLFTKLLKPSSFSPILAVIGVVLTMFAKKEKKKDIGMIMIGFAILMFGMDTMSGAVKPLADVPEFTNMLLMFSQPILGLIAGAVLTAVIQSSSASVGILQALCLTGAVGYNTAIPIIMGQNIGTCVTALLSGIGASKNAKRASLIHLYFNVIGTVIFMALFYILHGVLDFGFMHEAANAAGIAVIHTVFNVFATIVLFPLGNLLVKLAEKSVSEKKDKTGEVDVIAHRLDPRFLETPSFAVDQCRDAAVEMARLSKKALVLALDVMRVYDEKKIKRIFELEDTVDKYEDMLGSYLVKLSGKSLTEEDSRVLSVLLHSIGDWERISDYSINLVEAAQEMHDKNIDFSVFAQQELEVFGRAIRDIIEKTECVFVTDDLELAKNVEPLEEVIDDLNAELKVRHVKRLRAGECTIELGFVLSDITTSFERIADHCSNIAVCLIEIHENEFDTHKYLGKMKQDTNQAFVKKYETYKNRYVLP